MAEAVGLAASAITLAALFSSCIDCFTYFKAAQNCPVEAETLLVKLDCEKAKLLIWANSVGILSAIDQGRRIEFNDEEREKLVRRCIEQIAGLLTDAHKLRTVYGGRQTTPQENQRYLAIVSVNSMNVFKTSKSRFFARFGAIGKSPDLLVRVKWAVRDAVKFRLLLKQLREFVDDLIALVPIPVKAIDDTVQQDIVTMIDIGSLKLTENACRDHYPSWSARASAVISDSEVGTVDRRHLEELLEDVDESQQLTVQPLRPPRDAFNKVLTHECFSSRSSSSCEPDAIGAAMLGQEDFSFMCPPVARWSLGRRLKRYMNERRHMGEFSRKLLLNSKKGAYSDTRPMNRNYIYCGPCACAIQAALNLCRERPPEYSYWSIRIDDRLPTSCFRDSITLDVLEAIRDTIDTSLSHVQTAESPAVRDPIECIDCPHLETRIRFLEDFDDVTDERVRFQEILDEQYESLVNLPSCGPASITFIAEANSCQAAFDERPFRREARRPRKTEIFMLRSDPESNAQIDKVFIGSYTRSQKALDKDRIEKRLHSQLDQPMTADDTSIST